MQVGDTVVTKKGHICQVRDIGLRDASVFRARFGLPLAVYKLEDLKLATIEDAKRDYQNVTNKESRRWIRHFASSIKATQ